MSITREGVEDLVEPNPEPSAEEVAPDCSASYESANALLNETKFDNDNGSIFLIGGDECSEKHLQTFRVRNDRVKKMKKKWYRQKTEEATGDGEEASKGEGGRPRGGLQGGGPRGGGPQEGGPRGGENRGERNGGRDSAMSGAKREGGRAGGEEGGRRTEEDRPKRG